MPENTHFELARELLTLPSLLDESMKSRLSSILIACLLSLALVLPEYYSCQFEQEKAFACVTSAKIQKKIAWTLVTGFVFGGMVYTLGGAATLIKWQKPVYLLSQSKISQKLVNWYDLVFKSLTLPSYAASKILRQAPLTKTYFKKRDEWFVYFVRGQKGRVAYHAFQRVEANKAKEIPFFLQKESQSVGSLLKSWSRIKRPTKISFVSVAAEER